MNISIILPVHEYSDKIKELLKNSLMTVESQEDITLPKVLLVYAGKIEKEIKDFVKEFKTDLNIELIKNDGKTDFQSQVNFGVTKVDTDYFSILEFDDEYSTTYFKIAKNYIEKYDDIDLFLPFIVEANDKRQRLKFTNETVWSKQFVGENGELGYLNSRSLGQYTDFKIVGGIFKKEEFVNSGGLKSNIKLTFQLEFLLRMLNNGSKIFSIPKVGYMHLATREGSLFDAYAKSMDIKERKFWFDVAQKEYSFFNDREIDMSLLDKTEVPSKQ